MPSVIQIRSGLPMFTKLSLAQFVDSEAYMTDIRRYSKEEQEEGEIEKKLDSIACE